MYQLEKNEIIYINNILKFLYDITIHQVRFTDNNPYNLTENNIQILNYH